MTREPRSPAHLLVATFTAILLASASGLSGPAVVAAQPVPTIDPLVRVSAQSGRVRVMVELQVQAGPDDAGREGAIAQVQDEVVARLPPGHFAVARRFGSVPMIALEIDDTALAAVEVMGDVVVSVKADTQSRPQ